MITYEKANKKIENLSDLNFALYGDTKGEIRKYCLKKVEKHLFQIRENCPEEYLNRLERNSNEQEG